MVGTNISYMQLWCAHSTHEYLKNQVWYLSIIKNIIVFWGGVDNI